MVVKFFTNRCKLLHCTVFQLGCHKHIDLKIVAQDPKPKCGNQWTCAGPSFEQSLISTSYYLFNGNTKMNVGWQPPLLRNTEMRLKFRKSFSELA